MNSNKEKPNYQKWKTDYQSKRKSEKNRETIKNGIIVLTTFLFFFLGYFIYQGKHQFIGQQTTTINANIYRVGWWHWGRGYYKETIYFDYKYNDMNYQGYARIGSLGGRGNSIKEVGDRITIRISKSNPKNYKFLK